LRLLLDTHIALWAVSDDPRLSDAARKLISDKDNEVFVSVATLWEIAIKYSLGRDRPNSMPIGSETAQGYFRAAGYKFLDIAVAHVHALQNLPPVHNDPFDRILLAQAYEVPLRFLTHDQILPLYGDYVMKV
jgi:PIN domain nuclease of toxin-antitoxin system